MNIYIASFKKQDMYDYEANIFYNADWWREYFKPGDVVKAGTILKVVGVDGTQWEYDSSRLPAYLIAKEDFTVDSNMEYDIETVNRQKLHFGRWNSDGKWYVDVINENGKWWDKGYTASNSIWDTCTPNNQYANEMPWTFITEGVITDYISFQWNDKYNEAGQFTLVIPMTESNIELLQPGRYILIEKTNRVMIIEGVKLNANLMADGWIMQVTGRSLESILDRRVAFPGMGLNTLEYKGGGGLVKALYDMFDAFFVDPSITAQMSNDGEKYFYYPDRRVPFFEQSFVRDDETLLKRPFNSGINKAVVKDDLYTIISETCQNNELGFRIIPFSRYGNSRCINWKFEIYNGADKSYGRQNKSDPLLIFSPTLNNVKSIATTRDTTNYKNVIFCGVEKDSEAYIDLSPTNTNSTGSLLGVIGIQLPNAISSIKNRISSKLQDNPVTYTGILILALAGARKDKSYNPTVKRIDFDTSTGFNWADIGINPQATDGNYGYPTKPISKQTASLIKVTVYQKYGDDLSNTSKTATFRCDEIDVSSDENRESFKGSTAFGWLTQLVLREATEAANAMPGATDWTDISGYGGTITKSAILLWFRTFDAYTGDKTMTKWLCQEYVRNNFETGIDRRETFVDQDNNDNDDWDASAINAWRQSTTLIKVNSYDDEESDEEINVRLLESARKQSGQFNKTREVDIDAETDELEYMYDYELGDVVQVDDGHGSLETYMITGVVISSDTTDGDKTIPEFTKYTLIPEAYKPLEFIAVANMLLPVIFSPRENVANSDDGLNYGAYEPDFGPRTIYGYDGYIDEIFWERRSKVTEINFDGGYIRYTDQNGKLNDYKPNFAMISAIGFEQRQIAGWSLPVGSSSTYTILYNVTTRSLMPFVLLNTICKWPLKLGANGIATPEYSYVKNAQGEITTDKYSQNYNPNSRHIIQYMGDNYEGFLNGQDITEYWESTYCPGAAINFYNSGIDTYNKIHDEDSIENLYYTFKDLPSGINSSLQYHSFVLNRINNELGPQNGWDDNYNFTYSISNVDDVRIVKRPQYEYSYPYRSVTIGPYIGITKDYTGYVDSWEYDYGYGGDDGEFNNSNRLPWNMGDNKNYTLITQAAYGYETKTVDPETGKITYSNKRSIYAADNSQELVFVPARVGSTAVGNSPQSGAYGQVSFDHTSISNVTNSYMKDFDIENNSNYRYIVLGGLAYILEETDGFGSNAKKTYKIVWHSGDIKSEITDDSTKETTVEYNVEYGDIQNGVTIRSLQIYEYDSSYRCIRWSSVQRDNPGEESVTKRLSLGSYDPTIHGNAKFTYAEAGSENPSIESRRLVHNYIPVEYVDVGDVKLEDVEKYGLYDTVDQVFIPVNNNPLITAGFSGNNDMAKLIRAGGEIARE